MMDAKGFSLVELSIVLVILGLLTGGILTGQNLIRAAELRSVTTDFKIIHTAVMTFQAKYRVLPGDMANATRFWGSAGGNESNAACIVAQSLGSPLTCNANGNGFLQIGGALGGGHTERLLFWKHLGNASLVQGDFSGKTDGGAGSFESAPGLNTLAAKIAGTHYDIIHMTQDIALHINGMNLEYHAIQIMYPNSASASPLLPEESWHIDKKIDDSLPATGSIIHLKRSSPYSTNCVTSDDLDAQYDLDIDSYNCRSMYRF